MGDEILLEVRDLVKRFPGTLALDKVRLTVRKGEAHALVGENGAGKSTLMNSISGVLSPDEGVIRFLGKEVHFQTPKEAQDSGIGFVHQELSLCSHLKASENIFLGRLPRKAGGLTDQQKLYRDSKALLDKFSADFSPDDVVSGLTVAQQQIIEIAKALALNCKLLILDEPTSSLTEQETQVLFRILRDIKTQGISILYISHRMEEIFQICDTITILRDGCFIQQMAEGETSEEQIVQMMVGRNIDQLYPPKSEHIGEPVLKVRGLSSRGKFRDISFDLREGEILGFYGLVGAGRTEVMRAVCGIDPRDSGDIKLNGRSIVNRNYREAIDNEFAYLTEDRKLQGLFLEMTIEQNVSAAKINNIRSGININSAKEEALCKKYMEMLRIKASSCRQKVSGLSGGNQQKVMIGKWLATAPKVLIMDEPTRGIDVGAKSEIHRLIRKLSNEGICIIIVSSDLPEIIGLSDRVLVMHEGIISGELKSDRLTEENIIVYASSNQAAYVCEQEDA